MSLLFNSVYVDLTKPKSTKPKSIIILLLVDQLVMDYIINWFWTWLALALGRKLLLVDQLIKDYLNWGYDLSNKRLLKKSIKIENLFKNIISKIHLDFDHGGCRRRRWGEFSARKRTQSLLPPFKMPPIGFALSFL